MRNWMEKNRIPYKLVFIIMGIASTIWFLIRVIPKPSRATYPCMKVAAPFMSGFVVISACCCRSDTPVKEFKKKDKCQIRCNCPPADRSDPGNGSDSFK